jgi:anti-anti-sigma regulatory factor
MIESVAAFFAADLDSALLVEENLRRGRDMAKYRHRIFEMYDSRQEAIGALASRSDQPVTEAAGQETWTSEHLAVSRSARVTHVEFKRPQILGEETVCDFREDFAQLADRLDRDSKVLLDFAGVVSFSSAAISTLSQFNQKLRSKGSRMVLCSLDPTARECFFADRSS